MPTATATHTPSGTILAVADSSIYQQVEGNVYFPAGSLLVELSTDPSKTHLQKSETHYTCPWKGQSHYYHLVLADEPNVIKDIGWYYPQPKAKAEHIKDAVAWDRGQVEVKIES